jgi:hypothetical protein
VLAAVLGGAALLRACLAEEPTTSQSLASASAAAELPPRCSQPSDPFVVGDVGKELAEDADPMLTPFAVVVGRAIHVDAGFAVPTLSEGDSGSVANIVRIDEKTGAGSLIKLARMRGDLDPPALAATGNGDELLVAWLEPNASSRSVRLGKINGTQVTKGAELPEGRDDSLALDVAAGRGRGVVVWDMTEGDKSSVLLASFDSKDLSSVPFSRRMTAKEVDADSPRIVATQDGFFLVYLVHGAELQRESFAGKPAAPEVPPAPKKRGKSKNAKAKQDEAPSSDEVDESQGGESIGRAWVYAMPLDGTGAQRSEALRISPEESTVAGFDAALAEDGALVVAFRDDDAPTGGAAGGPLQVVRVTAGGSIEKYATPEDEAVEGIPSLLPGWLSLSTLRGPDVLARVGSNGLPKETPQIEPSLGTGEPIAAGGNLLLLAEPKGRAMRLFTVRCLDENPAVAAAAAASAAPSGSAATPSLDD